MADKRRLNHLKHYYNELIGDKSKALLVENYGIRNSFRYLTARILNAKTDKEADFFITILKRIVDPHHIDDDADLILYETSKDELFFRIWYGCGGQQFFIDTDYPEDAYSTFDAEDAFKHIITVDGRRMSVEDYLSKIEYDYSYIIR